jgi:hypothetical protein
VLRFFISLIVCIGFFSCERKGPLLAVFDFLPIVDSAESIFEVQETKYAINQEPVSRTYFLREKYSGKVETGNSTFSTKIERYSKSKAADNWKLDSVWTLRKLGSEYILNANNEDKVLMIQPLNEKSLWNINAYNTGKEKKIKEIELLANLTSIDRNWTDLAKITYSADSSILEKNTEVWYYKNNEGLVYKAKKNLVYCQETPDCIGKKQISYGVEISMKRLSSLP